MDRDAAESSGETPHTNRLSGMGFQWLPIDDAGH